MCRFKFILWPKAGAITTISKKRSHNINFNRINRPNEVRKIRLTVVDKPENEKQKSNLNLSSLFFLCKMIQTYKSYKHLIIFTYFLKNNVLFSFGVIVQLIAYLHAILCKSPSIVNQYNFSELPETKTALQLLMGTPKWVFHVKLPMTTTNTFFWEGNMKYCFMSKRNKEPAAAAEQQQQQ